MVCIGYVLCYTVLVYGITNDTWILQRTVNLGSKKINGILPLYMVAFKASDAPSQPSLSIQNIKDSVCELLICHNAGNCTNIYIYLSVSCQAHLDIEDITFIFAKSTD